MNNIINQMSESSHVDGKEQLNGRMSVVGYEVDTTNVESLVKSLESCKTKFVCSYKEAKSAGLKIAFLEGNRDVYSSQIDALRRSASANGVFDEACKVVPLKSILLDYPEIEAYDLEGNKVTSESPDLEYYVAIYDGQHRIVACELHPNEIDANLQLDEFKGINPLISIKNMNTLSRNWGCNDLRTSNVNAGLSTNKLYEEAELLRGLYDITTKLAEYILTFQREATRKKDLIAGKDTTLYNEENANRGKSIFEAAMMNFDGAKECKRLEFISAIVSCHNAISDKEKAEFTSNMKLTIGTMPEDSKEKVRKFISEKNYGELNKFIFSAYKDFCKLSLSDCELTERESQLDEQIAIYVSGLTKAFEEKVSKKPLKHGRVHDVISHNIKVLDFNKEKKIKKAEQKADIAKRKAEEAQTEVDNLRNP